MKSNGDELSILGFGCMRLPQKKGTPGDGKTPTLGKIDEDRARKQILHALDKKSWQKMKSFGVLEFLEGLKKDQRIINTGFSYHGDRDTFKEIIDAYSWAVCQIQYNYLDVQNQAGRRGLKYADK